MTPQALTDALCALTWEEQTDMIRRIGRVLACCGSCGCYIGAPYCHAAEAQASAGAWEDCPCPEAHPQENDDTQEGTQP